MKGIGEKVLGWFVVEEGAEEEEEASRAKKGTSAGAAIQHQQQEHQTIQTVARQVQPTSLSTTSSSSFAEICRTKGIPHDDVERLGKVLDLLATLPQEATHEVKRAIVGAALNAFGIPIDQITMTANGAVAAIDAHVSEGDRRTSEVVTQAESRIQKLSAEIMEVRRLIDLQRGNQRDLAMASAYEKSRVQSAIDFFRGSSNSSDNTQQPQQPRLVRLK